MGIGLYYTYGVYTNTYNVIYYFYFNGFTKGGYINGNWNYKVII